MVEIKIKNVHLLLKEQDHNSLNIDKARLSAEIGRLLTWEEYVMMLFRTYRRGK